MRHAPARALLTAAALALLLTACGGSGDGDGGADGAGAPAAARDLADRIQEQTGAAAGGAEVSSEAAGLLCDALGSALPEMRAHRDDDPSSPVGPLQALGDTWEAMQEDDPEGYQQVIALQVSDPDAADEAASEECPDVRDEVVALGQQSDLWSVLASTLS